MFTQNINFNNLETGLLTEEDLKIFLSNVKGLNGIKEGRCKIVEVDNENAMEVTYPKGKIGAEGDVRWSIIFDKPYDEFTIEYKVKVDDNFDFVRGGKLPGLFGGSGPSGGASVKEADGFSSRIMWRELGVLCQYVYYMDKQIQKKWGENFLWISSSNKKMPITPEMWETMNIHFPERIYLTPSKWHTLKTYIKMNTPGNEDGKIISWFNGEEVVNVDLRFRNDLSFGIDRFKFTTFFGGNDETWAPKKDEKMYFKDFKLSSDSF